MPWAFPPRTGLAPAIIGHAHRARGRAEPAGGPATLRPWSRHQQPFSRRPSTNRSKSQLLATRPNEADVGSTAPDQSFLRLLMPKKLRRPQRRQKLPLRRPAPRTSARAKRNAARGRRRTEDVEQLGLYSGLVDVSPSKRAQELANLLHWERGLPEELGARDAPG